MLMALWGMFLYFIARFALSRRERWAGLYFNVVVNLIPLDTQTSRASRALAGIYPEQ